MSYLRCVCLFSHSDVEKILFCVFCFVRLRLVYPMLPVSLDCPFLIATSVLCNVIIMVPVWSFVLCWTDIYCARPLKLHHEGR